ncbi:MAG: 50S ribosomal protein L13 [Candidatus Poribacteria bacterium]|nr:50S ribosomal protein L13 [Candidatus Poribacteria bacterium]MDE0506170.1 50S ribosomal protein L13 [Candidatus Poribacteria bacterium]
MGLRMQTYFPKSDSLSDEDVKWYVVDAGGQVLGRLATRIASVLRGKHHPTFTPHADPGFRVAVINADKVVVTGNKSEQKTYFRHSGYPGGDKYRTFNEQMELNPELIIRRAVKGMLPKNRLGDKLIKKMKVYSGPNHPHQAQQPQVLEV